MGVSHLVMVEQGIVVPGSMAIAVDSHGPTMGAGGEIYLASPATVAASAIEGRIANLLNYL